MEKPDTELSLKKFAAFAVPYSYMICCLYLLAFWGSFNFNIFEFVGFQEIVKLSLYSFIGFSITSIVGVSVSELIRGDSLPPLHLNGNRKAGRVFFYL